MVSNPLFERIKNLKNFDFQSSTEISNRSLRERSTYNQAITFFIVIAYLIIDLKTKSKHNKINN